MNFVRKLNVLTLVFVVALAWLAPGAVMAAETKIGFVSIQKVLFGSKGGAAAREKLQAKEKKLMASLESDLAAGKKLQEEIAKKQSVWSAEKLAEKRRELAKLGRDVELKKEDAQYEVVELRKKLLNPILEKLDPLLKEYGTKGGYDIIMDADVASRSGLIVYGKPSLDITKDLVKKLNEKL
ncbi:MAG: OmpH family outer membrane protein [Thermodesulfobacteriota bacterium]